MADEQFEADDQDMAEAFDETHREGEDPSDYDAEDALDPDLDSRAYDATSAIGDEDEDEDEDLDDLDDDDLDDEDIDDEEEDDVEALHGDGLTADEAETADWVAADRASHIRAGPDEAELTLAEDLDAVATPRNRQADKFESEGPLSDEQIADLGYAAKPEPSAKAKEHESDRVDEGLEETFPASDPVAVHYID